MIRFPQDTADAQMTRERVHDTVDDPIVRYPLTITFPYA
jgi:hypothetical protein